MESPIDERYRLKLLEYYLDNAKEGVLGNGAKKWEFICPFCGSLGRTEGRRTHRKGSLLWNTQQYSWVFSCAKKGSVECMNTKTFGNLISALNPALGEAYKQDRWHSGTTGKGHNCGASKSAIEIGVIRQSCNLGHNSGGKFIVRLIFPGSMNEEMEHP